MYKSEDISIVIPTYNRPDNLELNLNTLNQLKSKPREVLVIDDSEDDSTKKLCLKYRKKIRGLKYLRGTQPKKRSIANAKNVGVANASKKSKILLFLDDDAHVGPNYLDEMIAGYNRHPKAAGIFGAFPRTINTKTIGFKLSNLAKRIFLLGPLVKGKLTVNSPYGNKGWLDPNKDFCAEWFPGTNPSYKKEVFNNLRFDENFRGWSLGEDVDASYRIFRRYGPLYVIPASIEHKHPQAPYDLKKAVNKIYMNQINHFYLFYKDFYHMKIQFTWNLIGISLYRISSLLNLPKFKNNFSEFKHFIKSFIYCIKNKKRIIKGDISIPDFKL